MKVKKRLHFFLSIFIFQISVSVLAENSSVPSSQNKDREHFSRGPERGGKGAANRDQEGEASGSNRHRLFDSFGDSLRAAEEKHQAQVEAVVSGNARAPRGSTETFHRLPTNNGPTDHPTTR